MALNKSKTKLAPICGKFRRKTIDLKDELFKSIQSSLGNRMIALGLQPAPVTPTPAVTVPPQHPSHLLHLLLLLHQRPKTLMHKYKPLSV